MEDLRSSLIGKSLLAFFLHAQLNRYFDGLLAAQKYSNRNLDCSETRMTATPMPATPPSATQKTATPLSATQTTVIPLPATSILATEPAIMSPLSPKSFLSCTESAISTSTSAFAFVAGRFAKVKPSEAEPLKKGWEFVPVALEPIEQDWQILENISIAAREMRKAAQSDQGSQSNSSKPDFVYATFALGLDTSTSEELQFGHFSLRQPATTWCQAISMDQEKSTFKLRIQESIRSILKENGVEGVLQVILWATTYMFQSGDSAFWSVVDKTAKNFIKEDKRYLVLVDGHLAELQRALGGKTMFPDGTAFIVDKQCYIFYAAGLLDLLGFDKALKMLGVEDL
jgi:hypothetical protein